MEKDNDFLDDQLNGDEDLFDLSLDDLSPEEIEKENVDEEPDEDIIELIDLVEKGDKDLEGIDDIEQISEADQLTKTLDDELESGDLISDTEGDTEDNISISQSDLDLSDMSLETDFSLLDDGEAENDSLEEEVTEYDLDQSLEKASDSDMDLTFDGLVEQKDSFDDLLDDTGPEDRITDDENLEDNGLEEGLSEEDFDRLLDESSDSEMDTTINSPIEAEESPESQMEESGREEPLLEEEPGLKSEIDLEEEPLDFYANGEEDEMAQTIQSPIEISDDSEHLEESVASDIQDETAFGISDEAEGDLTQPEEIIDEQEVSSDSDVEKKFDISEGRIEAIVERVVGNIVERVARETMAEVAEKLISEAIDSLKKSLESNSD